MLYSCDRLNFILYTGILQKSFVWQQHFYLRQWKNPASNFEEYLLTTVSLDAHRRKNVSIHWSQIGGEERKGRCQVAQFTSTSNVLSMQQKSNASAQFTTKSTLHTTSTVLHQPPAHQSQLCCPNKTKSIAPAQFNISHKSGAERKVPSNIIHHQHNMLACQNR